MNKSNILTELQTRYPGKKILCLPEENPTEIICEIEPTSDHPKYSRAIAVIGQSLPHRHNSTTETYEVLRGKLAVIVDGMEHILAEGDKLTINPNSIHSASGDDVWTKCYSEPGWSAEDHIFITEFLGD